MELARDRIRWGRIDGIGLGGGNGVGERSNGRR
jgi:hypothetical protein